MNSRRSFLQTFAAVLSSASLGKIAGRTINDSLAQPIANESKFSIESFDERATHVMQLATQEALQFSHEYVGTDHLLIALFSESEIGQSNWLAGLNAESSDFRDVVECLNERGSEQDAISKLPNSDSLQFCLNAAVELAQQSNGSLVKPGHLLLSILNSNESSARLILKDMWFDHRQLSRFAVRQIG